MSLITLDITKKYLSDKISLNEARISHSDKENNARMRSISQNEFFQQSFLLLKETRRLSHEERVAYIEILSSKLKKIKANRELSVIKSKIQNYLMDNSIDLEKINQKLDELRTRQPGLPKIYQEKFNNLFTHLVLDSVSEKKQFRSSGFNNIQGLLSVRDLIKLYIQNKQNASSDFNEEEGNGLCNLYLALRNAINFRIVSRDFIDGGKKFENHKRLLTLMLEKTLEDMIGDKSTVPPFTFFSLKSKNHTIMLKVSYNRSDNTFSAELINTGYGCLKVDENYLHTTDTVFNGIKKEKIFNLIDVISTNYEKFEDLILDGRKALFSEGVRIEDGRYHCTQRGGSCVLKSFMSAIHGAFPNEVLYREFKVFFTKLLINKASKKRRVNVISIDKLFFAKEKILKKRELKLELAKAEAEHNIHSKENKIVNSKNQKRIEEIKSAIKEIDGRE